MNNRRKARENMFGQKDNIFARSDWLRHVTYVRLFNQSQFSKKWKTRTGNSSWQSLEKRILKWRRRLLISTCLELRCISEVSAVDFFDLFDPLHGISRVIFQVINTFRLKKKRKYQVFIDWRSRLVQSNPRITTFLLIMSFLMADHRLIPAFLLIRWSVFLLK